MNTLSTRTKLMFSIAVTLFVLFLFGESSRGQRFLTGDQQTGAGLEPFVYCAVPGGVLLILSFASYKADRRRVG
jgi:hypothetical protein